MKWSSLPGPSGFIEEVVRRVRDGVSVVVAAPTFVPADWEDAFVDKLRHDRWHLERMSVETPEDPLRWLTAQLYLEPDQWIGWSVERLCKELSDGQVIAVDGVTVETWDAWRVFLRDFEVASRQRASDARPMLLVFVRGVPRKRLQVSGAALALLTWSGVLSELDTLVYVDQRIRTQRKPTRHHKLLVRLIASLALWDLELADYLAAQSERELFDAKATLLRGRQHLGRDSVAGAAEWEHGGVEQYDGVEQLHPFVLLDRGDKEDELRRRLWNAQAAELLPQIEMRRRELAQGLERRIPCPFWLDAERQIRNLGELEIGSLAHVTKTHGIQGELRARAEWLANCRNTLAHLRLLSGQEALDPRLYESP